jgi:leucyl aminopeptidase (aminopeptidase T)
LKVRPSDEVLLVSDDSLSPGMIATFRTALAEMGAKDHLITYEPFHRYSVEECALFAGASLHASSLKLPNTLVGAMNGADAILLLNSDLEIVFAQAFKQVAKRKRILSLAYLSEEAALRLLPSSVQEVEDICRVVEAGGKAMESARTTRITSPQGTDITFSFGQYPVSLHVGVAKPGWVPLLPAGQVTRVPNDFSANGKLVINGAISAHDYKLLGEPIVIEVRDGNAVSIEGGFDAQRLRCWLEELKDPGMYHITEVSFGTNPRCRPERRGYATEDTHAWGIVSVALGCDAHFEGPVKAPAHCDMTIRFATLELDGKILVKDGQLQL